MVKPKDDNARIYKQSLFINRILTIVSNSETFV